MEDYQIVKNSRFWDESYYKAQFYINWENVDAIEHFINFGARRGISPSISFDITKYCALNPDVACSGHNALIHYELYGKNENRPIHAISDTIQDCDWPQHTILSDSRLYNLNYEKRRIGIYAAANKSHIITDSQIYFLEYMADVCDGIVYISQQYIPLSEIAKIKSLIGAYYCSNLSSCLMAYWTGLDIVKQHNLMTRIDNILLCNEDAYGPLVELDGICQDAESQKCKIWSLTRSWHRSEHYEILFMNYDSSVLSNILFMSKLYDIAKFNDSDVAKEIALTKLYNECGFSHSAMFDGMKIGNYALKNSPKYSPLQYPLSLLEQGSPIINRKCLADPPNYNNEGYVALMHLLKSKNKALFNIARNEFLLMYEIKNVHFTIIMATYNRINVIDKAIDSAMRQTHQNYNLIIVNDGSSDHTGEILRERYADLIKTGKITVIDNDRNRGLAGSRNVGLSAANNGWVCYLDDDNSMQSFYLEYFAIAIVLHPEYKLFYSQFTKLPQNLLVGRSFDYDVLLQGNFTDAGVIVHSLDLYRQYGGFTESLKTWEDFDFILRMSAHTQPYYLPTSLLNYNDYHCDRMSNTVKTFQSLLYIHKTHSRKNRVTTVLWGKGDEIDTSITLSSIINQAGGFVNEVWWISEYTQIFKNIISKSASNRFIIFHNVNCKDINSTNMKEIVNNVQSELIMFIRIGDMWVNPFKICEHVKYMESHPECGLSISPWLQIPSTHAPVYKTHFDKFKKCPSPLTASPFSVSAFCVRKLYFTLCQNTKFIHAIDPRHLMLLLQEYTVIDTLPVNDILCVTRSNFHYAFPGISGNISDKELAPSAISCGKCNKFLRGFRKQRKIKSRVITKSTSGIRNDKF